jgi:hypothetical protein
MNSLPFEIQLMILQFCNSQDIYSLCILNKNWALVLKSNDTWTCLYKSRFGNYGKLDVNNSKESFMIAHKRARIAECYELEKAWGNDGQYWRIEDSNDTKSRKVSILRYVFWLHVVGEFTGVQRGLYEPIFRIFVSSYFWTTGEETKLIIECKNENIYREVDLRSKMKSSDIDTWVEIALEPIDIFATTNVKMEMKEINTNRSKSGLQIDHFGLQRVTEIKKPTKVLHKSLLSQIADFFS